MKSIIILLLSFFLCNSIWCQCNIDSVCINSVLADPNSDDLSFDTDRDGVAEDLDEYVEICNKSTSPVDISGWSIIGSGINDPVFTFQDTILPADSCFVIVSNWMNDTLPPPPGIFDLDLDSPWIGDDGDAIGLINRDASEACIVTFGTQDCSNSFPNMNVCDDWEDPVAGCALVEGVVDCDFIPTTLPVEFSYFTVAHLGRQVMLKWGTTIEIDNDHFSIEWSKDGKDFKSIGKVEGAGNIRYENHYSFVHRFPEDGFNYYRIKQLDFDGEYEYTTIQFILKEQESKIEVYPLVTSDLINIEAHDLGFFDAFLFGTNGHLIRSLKEQKTNSILDVSTIEAGVYILNVVYGSEIKTFKIVKS